MQPPRELISALLCARAPVLVGHVNPDVDAVGSMLALARCLPGARAAVCLPDDHLSRKVRFLVQMAPEVPMAGPAELAAADLVVALDTAGTGRVNVPGKWAAIEHKPVVNIDHHVTNEDYGTINYVVVDAGSTCEIVHRLVAAAGWPLDSLSASLLYAGIYADTAGFSLPNVTAAGFETAAALVRAGADIERIGTRLCRSQQLHEFALLRVVYHNTRLVSEGHIAYSTLTTEEIARAGCRPEDIDDQVSIPRSLSGIRIAMLFSEIEPGLVRVNLRGEDGTTVLPLAEQLGGGGHRCSAGVRARGPFDQVVQRVLAAAEAYLSTLPQVPDYSL